MEPVEHDAEGTIAKLVPEPVIHAAKIMMDEDHDGLRHSPAEWASGPPGPDDKSQGAKAMAPKVGTAGNR
jgi:hypothetical protein